MFDTIRSGFSEYCRQLPHNIQRAVIESAVCSFAISALLSRRDNVRIGVENGILAATVALVGSCTMPLFRRVMGDRSGYINWYQQAIAIVINLSLTQLLINSTMTAYKVNLLFGSVFVVAAHLILNEFGDQSTYCSHRYLLF